MIIGRVTGSIWSTRHLDEMPAGALLEVAIDGSAQRLVAYDALGCGIGERVLITQGVTAARWFSDSTRPVDALIIGSIDERDTDQQDGSAGPAAVSATRTNNQ